MAIVWHSRLIFEKLLTPLIGIFRCWFSRGSVSALFFATGFLLFYIERVADSLQPMPYCRGINFPTHILYADDLYICFVRTRKNVCCVLCVFNSYVEVFR